MFHPLIVVRHIETNRCQSAEDRVLAKQQVFRLKFAKTVRFFRDRYSMIERIIIVVWIIFAKVRGDSFKLYRTARATMQVIKDLSQPELELCNRNGCVIFSIVTKYAAVSH